MEENKYYYRCFVGLDTEDGAFYVSSPKIFIGNDINEIFEDILIHSYNKHRKFFKKDLIKTVVETPDEIKQRLHKINWTNMVSAITIYKSKRHIEGHPYILNAKLYEVMPQWNGKQFIYKVYKEYDTTNKINLFIEYDNLDFIINDNF